MTHFASACTFVLCVVSLIVLGSDGPRLPVPWRLNSRRLVHPCGTNMLFTASDFPALAGGVDARTSPAMPSCRSGRRRPGMAALPGWRQRHHSSPRRTAAIPCPAGRRWARWTLAQGHPLKVIVGCEQTQARQDTRPRARQSRTQRAQGRREDEGRAARRAGPAGPRARLPGRPRARARPGPRPGRFGRAERPIAAAPRSRTNQEGADFQPPASAAGLARPRRAPPRADARDARPLADVSEDAA